MPHRLGSRTSLLAPALLVVVAGACEKDQLTGPEAEVSKANVKISLPAVPNFDLPPTPTDGSHTVKEMRVKGKKLLDTDITVKGVVTWAYDCMTAVREPGMSDKDVEKLIEEDPQRCERAKFYIGDAADTPAEKSMWVVDVPRPYNKKEMKVYRKKEERTDPTKCEPGEKDPKKSRCPPYKVGDQVEITGTWKLSSPHSERNSEGLLVYKKMKNVTQGYESPAEAAAPAAPSQPPPRG